MIPEPLVLDVREILRSGGEPFLTDKQSDGSYRIRIRRSG